MLIQINDEIYDQHEHAKLSVIDLGLNRGHAVFDYFRFTKHGIRFFEDHLDRIFNSIKLSNIAYDRTRTQLSDAIKNLIDHSNYNSGSIRLTVTAGDSFNFSEPKGKPTTIIVLSAFTPLSADLLKFGAKLISKPYKRDIPAVKTTNYFFAQMHLAEMKKADAIDILYYDDFVRETSRANIFLIKEGIIKTPKAHILEGITRKNILRMYPNIALQNFTIENLYACDEVFITSSSREVLPVTYIDNNKIGAGQVGEVTAEIMQQFKDLVS